MSNKILVTGGSGMVGKELKKLIPDAIYISSKDYDLTNEFQVMNMFHKYRPEIVIHLAARVGGIQENLKYKVEFLEQNVLMNTYVLKYAYEFGVKKFIGILSTCIYPDISEKYPMVEEQLHDGIPPKSNFSYAYAKRCLAAQIDAYNEQYGTNYNYLIPCNLYGIHDHFDLQKSHFIAALVLKIYNAQKESSIDKKVTLFGDGSPIRQFMDSEDLAKIIKLYLDNNINENMNICCDETYSIKEMVNIAKQILDVNNITFEFDTTKPNGQHRKDVSNDIFRKYFPDFKFTSLSTGIQKMHFELVCKNCGDQNPHDNFK